MFPDPGPFWRALPPPDSGRIVDQRVGRFRRTPCLVCSRPCRDERGWLRRALGRPPFIDGYHLCVACFARFRSRQPVERDENLCISVYGAATIDLSIVLMEIGIPPRDRLPSEVDFGRYLVSAMGAMGVITQRHDGVRDQLMLTGGMVSMWIPGIAGTFHARKAIKAGRDLSRAISGDRFLRRTVPGGVVVDTTRGTVCIVGGLGTALEFHAWDDATDTAVKIADSTTTGQFVVTGRAAAASRLRPNDRIRFLYGSESGVEAEDAYLIPIDEPFVWESD